MDIFCENCQKNVGRIADEKIPVGKKVSIGCPKCGEKIHFARPAEMSGTAGTPSTAKATAPAATPPPSTTAPQAIGNDFTIGDVIREAWEKTNGVKGAVWGSWALIFGIMVAVSFGAGILMGITGNSSVGAALNGALQLTITVAMYPFMAGVMMIGIRRSVDLPIDYKMAFGYFGFLLPLAIAAILTSLLTFVGFLLLFIPGIYLTVAYMLSFPLIVEKGMGPWEAMEASRKAIHKCWFKVFGLYLVMGVILCLSMIPLGLGAIWAMPMMVVATGVLYRNLFGVSMAT